MKKLIIALGLVLLVLIPLSCAKAPEPSEDRGVLLPPAPEAKGGPEFIAETPPAVEDRMIVRTADLALVVEDVIDARNNIAQLAERLDGYVVSSSLWGEEEETRGTISIRIPDEKFELALAELRRMAIKVKSENTTSQDVTLEYTDLKARLANAEATERQYLALLEKATDVEDILAIYEHLSRVRQEIEQIKGQMQYLERTASMSLISVYLEPQATAKPKTGWSALETFKSAVRGIATFGQWLAIIIIWLIVFIPVWGTAVGILYWRRKRKRGKASKAK